MTIFDGNEHRAEFWEAVRQAIDARDSAALAQRTDHMIGWALGLSIAGLALALLARWHHAHGD